MQDAEHASEVGYYHATCGIERMPKGTWLDKFADDWQRGHNDAIAAGEWATHRLVAEAANRETAIVER